MAVQSTQRQTTPEKSDLKAWMITLLHPLISRLIRRPPVAILPPRNLKLKPSATTNWQLPILQRIRVANEGHPSQGHQRRKEY